MESVFSLYVSEQSLGKGMPISFNAAKADSSLTFLISLSLSFLAPRRGDFSNEDFDPFPPDVPVFE